MNGRIFLVAIAGMTIRFGFLLSEPPSNVPLRTPLSTNRLAILLDEGEGTGENFVSSLSNELNAFFIQKTVPILFTTALWDRFMLMRQLVSDIKNLSRPEVDKRHGDLKKLLGSDYDVGIRALSLQLRALDAYKNDKTEEAAVLSQQLKDLLKLAQNVIYVTEFNEACLLTSRVSFNHEEWYCTRFGERFLLFVPKIYADKKGENLGLSIKRETISHELTDVFLTWDRLKNRLKKNWLRGLPVIGRFTAKEKPLGQVFLELFNPIFDMKRINQMRTEGKPLRWTLFLNGHGEQEKEGIKWANRREEGEARGLIENLENWQEGLSKLLNERYELTVKRNALVDQRERLQKRPFFEQAYLDASIKLHDTQIEYKDEYISSYNNSINQTTQLLNDLINKQKKVKKVEGFIASFSIPEFKTLLGYLSKKIDTSVFAYISCFVAGSNLYKTYQRDQESQLVEKHPFVIGMAGVTAGPSSAPGVNDVENYPPDETEKDIEQYKSAGVTSASDIESFFSMCEKDEPVDWAKAFEGIFAYSKFPTENMPLVKFPGTEWFMVPALKEEVLQIGKVMAATRDPKKKLVLADQKAILLYAPEIPFSIGYAKRMIDKDKVRQEPLVVSMIPGNACHLLKDIDASEYEASRVLMSFFGYPDVLSEKFFFIHSIHATNDVLSTLPRVSSVLSDVFCINHAQLDTSAIKKIFSGAIPTSSNVICFTLEDVAYGWVWPSEGRINFSGNTPIKIDAGYTKVLRSYLDKKYPKSEGFSPEKRETLIKVLKKRLEIKK